ncbi:hypothetical protein SHKM778_61060 [Streptomyces sp. KM77-8]|uniref:Aminotransferase class I/II-fold pyridoxal phosphate-dependent enzyme n=1 Tax=Streptomyces haneummycinicus TaxID=3074435 RepID=A0AAT9HQU9_9ACTN
MLAEYPETLLIEDDHGHHIVDLPLHALAGTTRSWAFVRSAAKAYGPDLRLAVLTGDAVTLDRVRGDSGWDRGGSAGSCSGRWRGCGVRGGGSGCGGRAVRGRREGLIGALERRGVVAYGRSGMNVWVPVPDETGVVARLLHAGWAVAPGARFRMNAAPGIRVTVSTLGEAEIEPLAAAIAAAVGPGGGRRGRMSEAGGLCGGGGWAGVLRGPAFAGCLPTLGFARAGDPIPHPCRLGYLPGLSGTGGGTIARS